MSAEPSAPAPGGQGAEGTPPVSPPAAPPVDPGAVTPPVEAPKPFFSEFKNAELRGYAERKAWKDSESLAESYMNLEKFHGVPADRLLKLPENIEDKEAVAPILAKLGYAPPAEAAEYGFADMEGADPEFAGVASAAMLEIGLPAKYAKPLGEWWNKYAATQQAALVQQAEEEVAVEMGQLRGEWSAKFEEKQEKARRAIRHFGFSEEELSAIETSTGAANLYRRFADAHDKLGLGEGGFVEGGRKKNDNAMSPEAARQEIQTLRNDKDFGARLLNKEAAAMARWTRLNEIASQQQGATP
jgi:hypothetical protein